MQETKTKQLRILVRPSDYQRWKDAADKLTGGNVSAFLTVAANEKAKETTENK